MSDADILALLTMVLCLMASFFFSGSETAITSFGERRFRRMLEESERPLPAIERWVKQPVQVLSTILLGNNIVNTLLGATATALTLRAFEGTSYASWAIPVAVLATTAVLLVVGEIVPKALGRALHARFAVPALTVLNVLARISWPFVWALALVTDVIVGRALRHQHDEPQNRVTTGEIDYLVKVGQQEGSIPREQADMLHKIFEFEDIFVRDIMVPRDRLSAVDETWSLQQIREVAARSGHSRLPVYSKSLDDIRGVLHIKQLVGIEFEGADPKRLGQIMRQPFFVSESLRIQDLLRRFKEQRLHLAIVVDDAGDTVGVVTLEDVLEQIVGQIFDESDKAPVHHHADGTGGTFYVDGQSSLHQIEESLGLEFEEIDGVASVGELLTRLAGQMPIAGSVFVWEGCRFKVLAADARRISRVSVERVELEDAD
jgi:putative hemolysin